MRHGARQSTRIVRALAPLAALLAAVPPAALAQSWPAKPIRIIVPLVPGGSTNNIARTLSEKLKEALGQPLIVENKPGADSMTGTEFVARAAPDGYTLLVQSGTHVILPFVEPKLPYDPLRDFAPVGTLARTRFVMLVHPSVPARTLGEFIAHAKARPGQVNFASSGSASGSRLAGEVFNLLAGVKMQNTPYKGGGQAMTDLLGGHVQVSFSSVLISAPQIQAGKLRGLAVTGDPRLPLIAQVPTFREAGLPAYDEMGWQGLFAPAATPRAVVERLSGEVARMQATPEFRDQYDKQGLEPYVSTPEQFMTMLRAETAKLNRLVKEANLKFTD